MIVMKRDFRVVLFKCGSAYMSTKGRRDEKSYDIVTVHGSECGTIQMSGVDVHINGHFGPQIVYTRTNHAVAPTCLSNNGNPACCKDYYECNVSDVPS